MSETNTPEEQPAVDPKVADLEARGAEHDSARVFPVGTVLLGTMALMIVTIAICVPLVLNVTKNLVAERQLALPTPDLDALRATEDEALATPKQLESGLYRIPIDAAKAALIGNPALLATVGAAPKAEVDEAAAAEAAAATAAMSDEDLAAAGKALFNGPKLCMACHKSDSADRLVGPGLAGVFGRETKLADGSTITADEAYLTESLTDPNAKVAEGFPPAMTPQAYTDAELAQLVAFLKTL
jgi:cytochrome c2